MGEQRNLTEENVEDLTSRLEKMQETNPDLEYRFFEQGEDSEQRGVGERIGELCEKMDSLETLVRQIFDGHVLIDGEFKKITP